MKAAILTDTTKCIGCNECAVACREANSLGADVPRRWDLQNTHIVEGALRAIEVRVFPDGRELSRADAVVVVRGREID